MEQLLHDAATRAAAYLASLDTRAVGPTPAAEAALAALDMPLPDQPADPADVLARLDRLGSPATIANAGGRYFGFVHGGSLPAALAAHVLAAAWDQNAFSRVSSPAGVAFDDVARRWLKDALRLPAAASGALVTGATMANFTGLAAARHHVLAREGWDVDRDGLFGAPPIKVVVGAEAHPTLHKALGLLGLGRQRVTVLPTDGQGRIRADALPTLAGPAIVCLQAGNVNTGAFDPAAVLIPWAKAADAWVHVDGAFGLWARASPRYAALAEGYEDADSWATDGHKWLNVPYDCGIVFVREPQAHHAAMTIRAAYLPDAAGTDPMDHTPEGSRRARGVDVWAALASLGRTGVADLVDRCCQHAARFAEGLHAAGFEILNEVVLNQVLVAVGDQPTTRRLMQALNAEGTGWYGDTVWQGRPALRISVSGWATTAADIDRCLAAFVRCAETVLPGE